MLAHSMVQEGHWLFQRRSLVPVLFLPVLVAAFFEFEPLAGSEATQQLWAIGCLAVSLLGLAVRAAVIGVVPVRTSGRNRHRQVAEVLNTAGPYSLCRNPLYVGNYLIWLGIFSYPHHAWLVACFTLAFWLYYERIIAAEEDFLQSRFGKAYEQFASTVPCVLPRWSNWRRSHLAFSLRNVLRREYAGLLGICLAFPLLNFAGHWLGEGRLLVEGRWLALGGFGFVQYGVLRTLRKQTQWLDVAGRVKERRERRIDDDAGLGAEFEDTVEDFPGPVAMPHPPAVAAA